MENIVESRSKAGTVDFRAPLTVKKTYRFLGMNREEGVVYIQYNRGAIYRCTIYLGEVKAEPTDYYELAYQTCKVGAWETLQGETDSSQEMANEIVRHLLGEQGKLAKHVEHNIPIRWYKRLWRKVFGQ